MDRGIRDKKNIIRSRVSPETPGNTAPGAGVSEYQKKVEEFFEKVHLRPRPKQVELATQIAERFDGPLGLEAPTGFGKTLTILSAMYAREEFPILWRVRTHDLARHIANQAAMANLTFYIAGGREKLCPLFDEHRNDIHIFCRYFKYKCPFYKPFTSVPDVYEFGDLVKVRETCPYYLQLFLNRDVIVAPYKLGLPFNVNAEIIDEAHNYIIDIQSIQLHHLKEAFKELSMDKELSMTGFYEIDPRKLYELAMPKLLEIMERGQKPILAPKVLSKLSNAYIGWVEDNEVYLLSFHRPRLKTLFVSATLGPLASLIKIPILRVEGPKIPAVVATWVTTRFRDFDVTMAHRYNDILFLMRKYFRRIVVFTSSRVASLLKFDYGEDDLPNLSGDWEGVLLLYSRGRKSEGVDIEGDAVLIAGAPYLPPTVKLSRLGISQEDLATVVTIQNVGRLLRRPEKRPFIVLGDERFLGRLRQHMEQYFDIQEARDIPELDNVLKQWHQGSQHQQSSQQQPS